MLDGDVDQPGAQRFLLLVRLSVVLHDFSPSEIDDEPLVDSGYLARCGIARERNDTGLETALVAVRPVHVSKFQVCGGRAAAGTERDEGAVVALFPRGKRLEPGGRRGLGRALISIDVAG